MKKADNPIHVVYKLRDRARKEDPRQLKFDELYPSSGAEKTEE